MTSSIQQNTPVSLKNVVIDDGFWAQRQANNREHTLPAIKHQMEKTGRVDAWKLEYKKEQPAGAGGQGTGRHALGARLTRRVSVNRARCPRKVR